MGGAAGDSGPGNRRLPLLTRGRAFVERVRSGALGPIDPQVIRADRNGNRMRHSVKNYLDAYDKHQEALKKEPNDLTAQIMLSKLDPETVQLFTSIMSRAREFAEKQLHRGMMKEVGNWSQAVSALLDSLQFRTHGQPISWEDASDSKIGLTVDYLAPAKAAFSSRSASPETVLHIDGPTCTGGRRIQRKRCGQAPTCSTALSRGPLLG